MTTKALISPELRKRKEDFKKFQLALESDFHKVWCPHGGQLPIAKDLLRDFKRYVFLQCGRKFGKTEFCIYTMYMFAILFPNSQIYYIADTMKHAGELVWKNRRLPDFFKSLKRRRGESNEEFQLRRKIGLALHHKYVEKANESEMRVYFKNGSFIKVDGAENYANADGIEPSFMVYDEFKSHDPRFNEAMEPNLKVHKAPLLIVGTPPEELGTYYEKIANSVKKMTYGEFYKRPSYMNPVMYPAGIHDPDFIEEKQKYLDRGDDDVFEREYMAEIVVSGSKAIFPVLELPKYDYAAEKYIGHSKHVRPHHELLDEIKRTPKDWDFHSVFDAGTVTCFAVLHAAVNKYDKRVVLLDEIYETDQRQTSTRQIYPRSVAQQKEIYDYKPYWTETYDNAAAWFFNEVQHAYGENMFPCTKDLKNKEAKLGQIKDLLIWGKLLISDKCIKMLWEMVNYRKDENGKIPKEDDHLIDCLRYLLNACHYDFNGVERMVMLEDDRRGHALTFDRSVRETLNKDRDIEDFYRRYSQVLPEEDYDY